MGRKGNESEKHSINFDSWMAAAINKIAEERGMTFTSVIHDLLRQELAFMGYNSGIGRSAAGPETGGSLYVHDKQPEYAAGKEVRQPSILDNNVEFIGNDVIYTPFYGQAAAGKPIEINIPPDQVVPWSRELVRGDPSRHFTIRARGSSMTEAGINDGDYVLMRHADAPEHNRIMLIRHRNESTVKRIKIKRNMEVYICWEDGTNQQERIDDEDYEIQGELVGVMRSEK
jgi:hypothetical protein